MASIILADNNSKISHDDAPAISGNFAYATLITSDNYLPGVQALVKSLKKFTSKPILVLASEQVSKTTIRVISALKVEVIVVPDISSPPNEFSKDAPWANSQYTKLNIWKLVQYEKVFYIDSDCIVLETIDDVFELTSDFAAAPDVFPPDRFNAGVLLIKPSLDTFEKLKDAIPVLKSYDGGDTGFLNAFFPAWYRGDFQSRLPFAYNAQRTMYYFTKKNPGYWETIQPVKILHFSSSPKPWEPQAIAKGMGELEAQWWAKFSER